MSACEYFASAVKIRVPPVLAARFPPAGDIRLRRAWDPRHEARKIASLQVERMSEPTSGRQATAVQHVTSRGRKLPFLPWCTPSPPRAGRNAGRWEKNHARGAPGHCPPGARLRKATLCRWDSTRQQHSAETRPFFRALPADGPAAPAGGIGLTDSLVLSGYWSHRTSRLIAHLHLIPPRAAGRGASPAAKCGN